MLIEEILPINYYNQLIGILVDTTILKSLIKKFMPQLSNIIENDKEYDGNFIGDAFINKITDTSPITYFLYLSKQM